MCASSGCYQTWHASEGIVSFCVGFFMCLWYRETVWLLQLSSGVGRIITGSAKKKLSLKNGEDLLVKMWHTVRTNNGIMVGGGTPAPFICRG